MNCLSLHSLLVVLGCAGVLAADKTTRGPEQLERVFQRFPEADTDKDGKLTMEEARAHLRKMKDAKAPASPSPAPKPPEGGTPATNTPTQTPEAKTKALAGKRARRGGDAPKPDFADVSYGTHPNNKLDLWLAKSDKPAPLVVFIHGGGFVGGDKATVSGAALKQCLDSGVSFASINYRFRTEASINTVLRDAARAVQFLRYKANDYNLDKTRFATYGGSAGAGTSLWLAFRDDLADPQSDDPVLRESTRLTAAASSAGQATYDILKWRDVLGSDEAMKFYPESMWPAYYGLKTMDDLQTEAGKKLRADVDMLGLISKDDPPVWLGAGDSHDALASKGDTNHSPKHSEAVKKRCDEAGVPAVLKVGNRVQPDGDGNQSQIDFLLKHLAVKPEAEQLPPAADPKAARLPAAGLEPVLGRKGQLLLEEKFDSADALSKGWTGKTGGLGVADGVLHASMKSSDGRLGLFNREQPMQDAAIQIDFKFAGARGINISCNPSPGELNKHGHLFSVMITPNMWNITEHNDKADPNSRSKALVSASVNFVPGQWYTLLLETRGDEVVARVEGKEPLRASSKDFRVRKPGIEFRVSGRDGGEVVFDNFRVWELK